MKIGVVLDNEFDNDHRVQKEVRLLLENGHEVFVLCFDFGNSYKDYKKTIVSRISLPKKLKDALVILNTNFPFYEMFWAKHIKKWISQHELDAIHAHDLYMAKPSKDAILKSKRSILLTLDLHENYPYAINSYQWATKGIRKHIVSPKKWHKKEAKYLDLADNIIVLSKPFQKDLQAKYPFLKETPFFTHPNMPDLESFKSFEANNFKVDFSANKPTLFYFGVVAKRRGIIDLLNWITKILAGGLLFHSLIIGPTDKADTQEFQSLINNPILKDNITYIPWSDVKYLPAYLKKIDIGLAPFEVNPQHDSGVANKLYQYMYGEIPILATPCKAQKKLIEDANCGIVYNTFEDFKNALTRLINDKYHTKELGENGKKNLLKLYSEQADRKFLEIYKN